MKTLAMILVCGLVLAGGCIQQSERDYSLTVDKDTGLPVVKVHIAGADTKMSDVEASTPQGWHLKITGLQVQDQTTAYSAQLGMYQQQTNAQLLGTILPALLAKVGAGSGAPAVISPPPAIIIKPSILDQPTTQPASK